MNWIISSLFELLEAEYDLTDHLLDSEPISGSKLEAEIREAQQRIRKKTAVLKNSVTDKFPISAPWGEPLDYDFPEKEFPTIVCLCGSTRFWRAFQKAGLEETLAGKIVLSIGAASGTDDEHFGNLPREEYDRIKNKLDWLHLRKIDLADEILVLNVGGYIGSSTRREIEYAKMYGKKIRWLEPESV